MDPVIIGIIGGALTLFAFFMNQNNRWANSDIHYDLTNLIASILLVIYAFIISSIPFLIINTVWGLVSAKDVAKYLLNQKSKSRVA